MKTHLKMEEHLKTFSSSNTTLVAKGIHPSENKNWDRQYKKAPHPYEKSRPKTSIAMKQKAMVRKIWHR